ncbi:hypothetical protein [Sulfurimonas sp.]|uniref:hypothetical protein n=1 Tax=Sulfurimonas sp. TaxID=2022749 RepID=UPI0025FA1683|nr:hypothetical protein [Sulfurimonas sp.]MBW6487493.1 hypothetical protein [Sulfurimonas sp.]
MTTVVTTQEFYDKEHAQDYLNNEMGYIEIGEKICISCTLGDITLTKEPSLFYLEKSIDEWRTPPFSDLPFSQGYAIQEIINSMQIPNVEKVGWGTLNSKTLLCVKTPKQHLFFTDDGCKIEALYFEEVSGA